MKKNNEDLVLEFLRKEYPNWVTPTIIGIKILRLNYNNASSYSSRVLKKLVSKGYAERKKPGLYRAVLECKVEP